MDIREEVKDAIKEHAIECYPQECCGLIVDGEYVRAKNVAPNPDTTFVLEAETYANALLSGKLQAIVHSHCIRPDDKSRFDPRQPSSHDMKSWLMTNVPWAIVATNGNEASEILWLDDNEVAPLLGRDFIHGVHDCYSLVRDYFRTVLNIKLKNYPRGNDWWNNGEDLYAQYFRDAGFYEISEEEADINDCCLFQVRSPVINHAAVITGNNQIMHHLFHRLSEQDRLDKWRKTIVKYVRYDPALNTLLQRDLDATESNSTRGAS